VKFLTRSWQSEIVIHQTVFSWTFVHSKHSLVSQICSQHGQHASLYMCITVCGLSVCGLCSVLEDEKVVSQKESSDLRSSLRDMETSHMDAQRLSLDLQHSLKSVETERDLLADKVNDLQLRLTHADDGLETLTKENLALKQEVLALQNFLLSSVNVNDSCAYIFSAAIWRLMASVLIN